MSNYNEIIENLKSLSLEELEAAKAELSQEFTPLHEKFSNGEKTRDIVEQMVTLGNAFDAVEAEMSERVAEEAELSLAAEEAANKIKRATKADKGNEEESTPNGDEDIPGEDTPAKPKEEEKKEIKEDVKFAADTEAPEDKPEEEDSEKVEEFAPVPVEEVEEEAEKAEAEADRAAEEADRAEDVAEDVEAVAVDVVEPGLDEEEDFSSKDPEKDQEASEGGDSDTKETADEESDNTESDSDMKINDFSAPAENAPENKGAEVERKTVTITAGADVKNFAAGSEMPGLKSVAQALLDRRKGMGRTSGGDGEQALVASFSYRDFYNDNQTLTSLDIEGNIEKVQAVVAALQVAAEPDAVVAAGGLYGPVETVYDIYEMGEITVRPVKSSLPSFNAERGGVRFMTPPVMADLEGAVSIWTLEDDIAAAEDDGPTKPCIRIKAGEEITVYLEAMPFCLTFGNLGARAWPELVERHIALGMALQARFAETRLLTRIGALSTQVTSKAELGAARDILVHLETATTAMRNRHRLDPKAPLRAMFPEWFRNALRADLVKQIPGDGQDTAFNLVDATIDKWFAARHVNVTWFVDGEAGQVFGEQADGELLGFPENVIWYLFPEGTFLHLDGGVLDLGLIRDSTLNSTNDYQMFLETFENVAKVGVESLRVTTPVRIAGASASTVDTIAA